jgi:hypothetical protein
LLSILSFISAFILAIISNVVEDDKLFFSFSVIKEVNEERLDTGYLEELLIVVEGEADTDELIVGLNTTVIKNRIIIWTERLIDIDLNNLTLECIYKNL